MQVVLIPGDGIGPEVTRAAQEVVEAAGVHIDWVIAPAGADCAVTHGDPLPESTLDQIRQHRVALKGPCTTPVGRGFRSINVRLRQGLDLYASVRPVKTLPGIKGPYSGVNLVVVRENTEGLYSGQEHEVVPGVVESLRIVTRAAAERIVRFAFEFARRESRHRVTFCHKADVMRLSDGLFLECARSVADEFPFIDFAERRIDNLCMELVLDPGQFEPLGQGLRQIRGCRVMLVRATFVCRFSVKSHDFESLAHARCGWAVNPVKTTRASGVQAAGAPYLDSGSS
jgi:isocitrate dehydrogenase (NAD+)